MVNSERFKPVFFVVIAMLLIFTVSPIYGANEVKEVKDEKTKIVVDDQLSVYKFNVFPKEVCLFKRVKGVAQR